MGGQGAGRAGKKPRSGGEGDGAGGLQGLPGAAGPRSPGRGSGLGEELSGAGLLGGVARAGREPGVEFPEVAGWED